MVSQDRIMRLFHMLLAAGEPVTLLNNYRGFPVEHKATILALEQGYIAIGIHEHQAVSMALERMTYIQNVRLPEVIRASVMMVDIVKKRAVLTEFEPAGNEIGKRSEIRVFPPEPIEVEFFSKERRLSGKIADISTSGVGVFTCATYIYGHRSFMVDTEVSMELRLPPNEAIVRFQGIVTSIADKQDAQLHRLGVRIYPDPEVQAVLEEFIHRRKVETEHELTLIFQSMCQEKTAPD